MTHHTGSDEVEVLIPVLARWGVRSRHSEWPDKDAQACAARDVLGALAARAAAPDALSDLERLAAAVNIGRLTWVGGGDGDFDLHLARAILPTVKTLAPGAAAPDALRERVEAAILRHADYMETYTLPALQAGFIDGWSHALRLLRRDAGFIAERAALAEQ